MLYKCFTNDAEIRKDLFSSSHSERYFQHCWILDTGYYNNKTETIICECMAYFYEFCLEIDKTTTPFSDITKLLIITSKI